MLSAMEFIERWKEDTAVPLIPIDVSGIDLPDEARSLLSTAGLPESAAPFLSFEADSPVVSLSEAFGLGPDLSHLYLIGSDDSGSPICIDSKSNGQIVIPDHETWFESTIFMNSTVMQLAECLLAYRQLVFETQRQNGEDAYLDGNIPPAVKATLALDLQRIDPQAMNPGCFWKQAEVQLGFSGE